MPHIDISMKSQGVLLVAESDARRRGGLDAEFRRTPKEKKTLNSPSANFLWKNLTETMRERVRKQEGGTS